MKQAIKLVKWICAFMGIEDEDEERVRIAAQKIMTSKLQEDYVKQAFQNAIDGNLDIKTQELRPFRISALYIMNVISSQRRHDMNKRAQNAGGVLTHEKEVSLSQQQIDMLMDQSILEARAYYLENGELRSGAYSAYNRLCSLGSVTHTEEKENRVKERAIQQLKLEAKKLGIDEPVLENGALVLDRCKVLLCAEYFEEELKKERV